MKAYNSVLVYTPDAPIVYTRPELSDVGLLASIHYAIASNA